MCGLCKLNAAALDTTVACGYNGIDQHNFGLLPPIAGIDIISLFLFTTVRAIAPPLRGLIRQSALHAVLCELLPPIAGIDTVRQPLENALHSIAPHRGD